MHTRVLCIHLEQHCPHSNIFDMTASPPDTFPPRRRRRPLPLLMATAVLVGTTIPADGFVGGGRGLSSLSAPSRGQAIVLGASSKSGSHLLPSNLLLEVTTTNSTTTVTGAGGESLSEPESSESESERPKMTAEERQNEFKMAVGRAIDTLRSDYPDILTKSPDFSIYHDDIEVVDPSGVTLHGLRDYKFSFRIVHALVQFFYCPSDSTLTFRLMYDSNRNSVRVSWNAVLIPRSIYGGQRNELHVDGISVYEVGRESGLIHRHHIEHLLLNDTPVSPQEGLFSAIRAQAVADGVPVLTVGLDGSARVGVEDKSGGGVGDCKGSSANASPFLLQFNSGRRLSVGLSHLGLPGVARSGRTSLFSVSDSAPRPSAGDDQFDEKAFDQKNISRKKFGLPPLTALEFQEVQEEVRKLEKEQAAKAAVLAEQTARKASELAEREKRKRKNGLANLFGSLLEDTCESNYDCERPKLCCDFGFKKMCCANGMMSPATPQMISELVPAATSGREEDPDFPQGGPGGMSRRF